MKFYDICLLSSVLCLLSSGCANIRYMGQVGNVKVYRGKAPSIIGPSINFIMTMPIDDPNAVRIETLIGGNGIGPALVGAGGLVGSSAVLRPTQINTSSGSASDAESRSSSVAPVVTPPNPPPRTRPPDNRPPQRKW